MSSLISPNHMNTKYILSPPWVYYELEAKALRQLIFFFSQKEAFWFDNISQSKVMKLMKIIHFQLSSAIKRNCKKQVS